MKLVVSMLMFVVLCLPASAQGPAPPTPGMDRVPVLMAEPTYQRDHSIIIMLDGLQDREFRVKWIVLPLSGSLGPEKMDIPNGIAIWAGLGHYRLIAVVAVPDWTTKQIQWYDLTARFEIVESLPGPDPPKPPDPSTGGFADVTKTVRSVVELVRSDRKAGEQKMIADSFAENARLSASDRDYDQTKLLEITQSNVVAEIGLNNYLKWKPVFTTIRAEIQRQMDGGKLKTKQDWVAIWTAISAGMR